jgi:glycosyltransferase involved in cell wall biosynthesis
VKVSILCFDLADNAVARAWLLARLLEPLGAVELIGPCYGPSVWTPLASSSVPRRSIPGAKLPRLAAAFPRLLELADGDLIYASKPRLASAGVGYLKRILGGRPLLLDIDDWEVGFHLHAGFWSTLGRALNIGNAKGLPWTWLMERLTALAGGVTVASRFLERKFGGVLIPHVRDTDAWFPGMGDRNEMRRRLGVERSSVVMFLGTPRGYKGVDDLCAAVDRLARPSLALVLVGTEPDSPGGRRLAAVHPGIRLVGRVPFDEVPTYLAAADVVAVPQRESSDTRGQVPAKIFDAMAVGRPIVSTRVSMIPEILEGCGVVVAPGDVDALARGIAELLDAPDHAAGLAARARERCVARYSFAAARRALFPLVERVMAGTR